MIMAIAVVNFLSASFIKNQGYWHFESDELSCFYQLLSFLLCCFVIVTLIKSRDEQYLQALLILSMLSFTAHQGIAGGIVTKLLIFIGISKFFLQVITPLGRWRLFACIVGLTATFWCLSMMITITTSLGGIDVTAPDSPSDGIFISKTDEIYTLYRFQNWWVQPQPVYALFREVPILPGLKLVKRMDYVNSTNEVCVSRTPDGAYVIVDGVPEN